MRQDQEIQGVFRFAEQFPGPHMIRVELCNRQAWEMLRQLSIQLRDNDDSVDFVWFGKLTRDAEEDKGNPIETA